MCDWYIGLPRKRRACSNVRNALTYLLYLTGYVSSVLISAKSYCLLFRFIRSHVVQLNVLAALLFKQRGFLNGSVTMYGYICL